MATKLYVIRQAVRNKLREILTLVTPGSPVVSTQGTAGATAYGYKIVAKNVTGVSAASQAGLTALGNAALSGVNFNQLNWTGVPFEDSGYDVYRTAGGATQGKIGSVATGITTFNDTGLAGDSATAPTLNTSGVTNQFWTDDELDTDLFDGCKDLWRKILDLHQSHFNTIDVTNVSLAANSSELTGVPADCFRVMLIQPRDISDSGSFNTLLFRPASQKSPEFIASMARSPLDPSGGGVVYYDILNAGSPVAAPTVIVAPQLTTAVPLRFVYIPTLGTLTESSDNPIPGESDHALMAWGIAFALAKERDDKSPDPNWLAVYATDEKSILIALTPRQEQRPRVVRGVFDDYDDEYG